MRTQEDHKNDVWYSTLETGRFHTGHRLVVHGYTAPNVPGNDTIYIAVESTTLTSGGVKWAPIRKDEVDDLITVLQYMRQFME